LRGWRPISAALPCPIPSFSVPGREDFPFTTGPQGPQHNRVSIGKGTSRVNPIPLWKSSRQWISRQSDITTSESARCRNKAGTLLGLMPFRSGRSCVGPTSRGNHQQSLPHQIDNRVLIADLWPSFERLLRRAVKSGGHAHFAQDSFKLLNCSAISALRRLPTHLN